MKAAVLGHPIAHSLSPVLHNAAYQALGLSPPDWRYSAIDVAPENLPRVLTGKLLDSNDWIGFSLTMPLKVHVVPWLDDVAAQGLALVQVDPLVTMTGAANTVVKSSSLRGAPQPVGLNLSFCARPLRKNAGVAVAESRPFDLLLSAYNTDVYGIVASIREVIRHGPVEEVAILGAGATAASALAAAKELGADSISIFARPTSSRELINQVSVNLGLTAIVHWENLESAASKLADFDAVISTLPAHAADPVAASLVDALMATTPSAVLGVLLDVVYDPYPTELVATWSALGGAVITGDRMLLHQAAQQVELMTGQPAPLAAMELALNHALNK